jgi:hypothetical protein
MTKHDKKEIRKLVKSLPRMQSSEEKISQTISGRSLIERGMLFLKDGTKVLTDKTYLTKVPKEINHQTEAENHFKIGGLDRVKAYCISIVKLCKEKSENEKRTISE